MARQLAMCGSRLLSRLIVDETELPKIQEAALPRFLALMPRLQAQLDDTSFLAFSAAISVAFAGKFSDLDSILADICRVLLEQASAKAGLLAAEMVAINVDILDQKEKAYQAQRSAPAKTDGSRSIEGLSIDEQNRLLTFIKTRFPDETALRLGKISVVAGGFSKQTLFIHLQSNKTLPNVVVMRRDGGYSASGTSVSREYPVIMAMHRAGAAVPEPFALEETGTVLGSKFILTAKLTGSNIGDPVEIIEPRPQAVSDLARKIARMHAVPIAEIGLTLGDPAATTRARVLADIERFHESWQKMPFKSFVIEAAFTWVRQHLDDCEGHRTIIHRDIGAHNFLLDGDKISGFLDWEVCEIGNPAEDLGYSHYAIAQMGDWDGFLAAYEQAAGYDVERRQLDFYMLWGQTRLLVMISEAKAAIWAGALPDLQFAYIGEHYAQILLQRISKKLNELLISNG